MAGVLQGVTVIELAGIGPGPFCGMMLADHGARVIRVERPGTSGRFGDGGNRDILNRNRERIELDLKDPAAIAQIKELAKSADALIEGYRPGVLERLGLGPEVLHAINPKLVIGRMTGWGLWPQGRKADFPGQCRRRFRRRRHDAGLWRGVRSAARPVGRARPGGRLRDG
ncbi:MAG: hypothetical protein RL268_2670 [Pseudomonadota bacterium]